MNARRFSAKTAKHVWLPVFCLCLATVSNAPARAVPDLNNPLGFFTTVADKLLRSTFQFGITNIPVYSNGVFVYTPAVQRLLQLSANIYDAANTNFFPVVFRPLFVKDAANNIFIMGYVQVTNVSGTGDPQLSPPYDAPVLSQYYSGVSPITDAHGPVNVYGVPWIIGAKKGLPGFNQFAMINATQVTRKLQVTRTTTDPATAMYATNQMYVMGISNSLGISFWNPYNAAYPRPLTVYVSDVVSMSLTNGVNTWSGWTNFVFSSVVNSWPGSQWSGSLPNAVPNAASLLNVNWSFNFLSPSVYRFNTASFDPIGSPTSSLFETTFPPLPPLPPFGLSTMNYLQTFILDGNNVIDYVQLRGPMSIGSLNQALADPNYPNTNAPNTYYQWSTNAYSPSPPTPYGVINQLWVSGHPSSAPAAGGQWSTATTPMGMTTPSAEAAFFQGFFVPSFTWTDGKTYVNALSSIQAPYTPTRTVFSSFLLQANDPLVHYLASDLNSQYGAHATWDNKQVEFNGVWNEVDSQPLPVPPTTPYGGRYQPWGQNRQMLALPGVDTNGYNLAYKDPLIWGPDDWNFPTNLLPSLVDLGQVHRGTPWQTVYLKSTNILTFAMNMGAAYQNIGSNTWAGWTGDIQPDSFSGQYLDAALMAPVSDWRLAGLLTSLLNTNDATRLFSVNDPNTTDWQNLFNGLIVYSNSTAAPYPNGTPTFDTYVMASNSPQALVIVNGISGINATRANTNLFPLQSFLQAADILAAPALTVNSPFLNLVDRLNLGVQTKYGITDAAYEAIPAQLLPLLRPDSFGTFMPTNGGWNLQFSGSDGYAYELQTSTNLAAWEIVSTNYPVQGAFTVPGPSVPNSPARFYRSVLLP